MQLKQKQQQQMLLLQQQQIQIENVNNTAITNNNQFNSLLLLQPVQQFNSNSRNTVTRDFDMEEVARKNLIQNAFYNPNFTAAYSNATGFNSVSTTGNFYAQQPQQPDHENYFHNLHHSNHGMFYNPGMNSESIMDETANLRLLVEVAVGLWEEQKRQCEFRN